jgi:hypothetical protein
MSDFVKGNDIGKLFLTGGIEAGALLGLGREKRESGKIKKARPSLTERTGNLGNAEATKRERATVLHIEMDGGIDIAGNLFQSVGGTGSNANRGCVRGDIARFACRQMQARFDLGQRRREAVEKGLFELTIGVNVDGMIGLGD